MNDGIKYSQVQLDSHFWTNLEQLLEFLKYQKINKEYLLTGLRNTKKNGYELQKLKPITAITKPYFINISSMVEYVEKKYNKNTFLKILTNTIKNGIELIQQKKVYKIHIKKEIKMKRKEVYNKIDIERDYQDLRWNSRTEKNNTPDEEKPPAEWLNYIEFHLNKAKEKVYMLENENALVEVRKVAALAVRCLEIHGCPERIIPRELK